MKIVQIGHYLSPHFWFPKYHDWVYDPLSQNMIDTTNCSLHFFAHPPKFHQQIQAEKEQLIDHSGFLQSTSNQQQHRCHATHLPCCSVGVVAWNDWSTPQSGKFQAANLSFKMGLKMKKRWLCLPRLIGLIFITCNFITQKDELTHRFGSLHHWIS